MKKIEATIKPFKLDEVKDELLAIGIEGLSACEIKGFGKQEEHAETYRGSEYITDCSSKVKLEVIVPDELASSVVAAIQRAARTGAGDDGKILVLPIEDAIRIRTGEHGTDASNSRLAEEPGPKMLW
jgi:nitrogen regulatory protein P-II 1